MADPKKPQDFEFWGLSLADIDENHDQTLRDFANCRDYLELKNADSRVNPADNNNGAIRHASENGHTNVVALLLSDSRVDPTANTNDAIRLASQKK